MKCDDFLPHLATGGIVSRMLARLHGAHCRRCAAELARFRRLRRQLAEAAPLTREQRELWSAALDSTAEPEGPRGSNRPVWTLAATGGIALVLVAGILFFARSLEDPDRPDTAGPQDQPTAPLERLVQPLYTPAELTELAAGLELLSADLDRLENRAGLLQAGREANTLVQTYGELHFPAVN